jgi:hypothetical protein
MANTPTLNDIAVKYKDLAQAGAPVKTGRLKNSIKTSYKQLKDLSYSLDLKMIGYGYWWNDPPKVVKRVKLSKKPQFNFVVRAINDKDLKDMILNYSKSQAQMLIAQTLKGTFNKV